MSSADNAHLSLRTRWGAIAMLSGFTFLGHFNRVGMSVVGDERLIGTGGLTEVQMGLVYSSFLAIYTLLMLPGGWFIDRVGPAAALFWMGIGFGTCAILTGVLGWMSLPLQSLWIGLVVLRGITGATSTPLHPGAARGVSVWAEPRLRSTANGLVTAAALFGISVTYPGFGWLINRLGWPGACAFGGALLIGFSLLWRAVAPRSGIVNPGETVAPSLLAPHESPTGDRGGIRPLLLNRSMLLLTLSYSAVGYFQYLFFYWIKFYFQNNLGLPVEEARWASFNVTMAMAVGMAVGGFCTDSVCRWLGDRWGRRFIAMGCMGLCAMFAYLGARSDDARHATVLFALSLGALGICEGLFWTSATDLGGRLGGFAGAIMNTGGNGVSALAPVITPVLAKHFGWESAIGVACAICALGGVMWLGIEPAAADSVES